MKDSVALCVEGVSKRYRLGQKEPYKTLRGTLAATISARLIRPPLSKYYSSTDAYPPWVSCEEWIWALKDVSFEVKLGEVVGIIGPNGAGKSTLLKILSRITHPSAGVATIYGRVGSLLEIGTGFNPELTGRENIYMNGTMLGMRKREIDQKFDEIVAFSEIEPFLDTPIKRFSSGMQMRLAFAIAAHLEPEILIVDEVLAVGDTAFQKKCLGQMGKEAKNGRTVLFVSHNMAALQILCNRVIRLHKGQVVDEGQPAQVISKYLQTIVSGQTEQVWHDPTTAPGNDQVRIHRICVKPEGGKSADSITMRTPLVLEFEFWNFILGAYLEPNFQLVTEQGIVAFASSPTEQAGWHRSPSPVGLFKCQCYIPGDLLMPGRYRVMLTIIKDSHHIMVQQEDILAFDVQDALELRGSWYGEYVGVIRPLLKWKIEWMEHEAGTQTES